MTDKRLRAFSGIQPSGKLHIGNYTGALKPWVDAQNTVDGIYCVVDLHALTATDRESGKSVGERSREVAALYLACGLNPESIDHLSSIGSMDSPIPVVGVRNPSALGMALENDAVQVEGKVRFSADRFADVSGLANGRHSSVRCGNCAGWRRSKAAH